MKTSKGSFHIGSRVEQPDAGIGRVGVAQGKQSAIEDGDAVEPGTGSIDGRDKVAGGVSGIVSVGRVTGHTQDVAVVERDEKIRAAVHREGGDVREVRGERAEEISVLVIFDDGTIGSDTSGIGRRPTIEHIEIICAVNNHVNGPADAVGDVKIGRRKSRGLARGGLGRQGNLANGVVIAIGHEQKRAIGVDGHAGRAVKLCVSESLTIAITVIVQVETFGAAGQRLHGGHSGSPVDAPDERDQQQQAQPSALTE